MKFIATLIVGLLIAAAIAWDAGERHYDNCVRAARVEQSGLSDWERFLAKSDGRIAARIEGCSRLPF